MHALCAVIGRNLHDIHQMIDYRCDCGDWDYASIGGRYENTIPVHKNSIDRFRNYYPEANNLPENGFPYPTIDNNPNCKYFSVARIRQIDLQECMRITQESLVNVSRPYSILVHFLDDSYSDFIEDEVIALSVWNTIVTNPRYSGYYVAVVDYHY